jgi:hypothetical protein
MPPKKEKPTNDELLAQLDDLAIDATTPSEDASKVKSAAAPGNPDIIEASLKDLDDLAKQRPVSRAGTPRVTTDPRVSTTSPKPTSGRTSEDKQFSATRSQDSKQTPQYSTETPSEKSNASEQSPTSTGGGWWGGLLSTATAAMKHAEAAVKEIQNNEEAQKWAEQVRGNVGAIRDFGM